MSNFRLHTPEELQKIAEEDFERFKEISKFYFDNDFEYFETTIVPIVEKHKNREILFDNLNLPATKDKLEEKEIAKSEISPPNKKNTLIIYLSVALLLVLTTILLYYILIFSNDYRQAVRLLKENKYDLALDKLNKIDSTSDNYKDIKSKISYAKGMKLFDENNFREAYVYLTLVKNSDEFYTEAKYNLDKINSDQSIIYQKGINHIDFKEFNDALTEFQKIKPTDIYYTKAQSKIMYIRGMIEFELNNYESADSYFKSVDKSDEYYKEILLKQPAINSYVTEKKNKEESKYYAGFLIRVADKIQDEYQLMTQNNTFQYTKNTYLKNLVNQRSELNSNSYSSTTRDKNLVDFKKLILSWVNSYINYGEDLGTYGYRSSYNADYMWANYGYILYSDKNEGYDLHQKVIKKYKEVQALYGLN